MPNCVVSDRFRFIWIHIAKNASTTLGRELVTER